MTKENEILVYTFESMLEDAEETPDPALVVYFEIGNQRGCFGSLTS